LQILTLTAPSLLTGCGHLGKLCAHCFAPSTSSTHDQPLDFAETQSLKSSEEKALPKNVKLDQQSRSHYFDRDFPDDIYARGAELEILQRLARKIGYIQSYVGHGHFNILGWDEMIRFAAYAPGLSPFSTEEKAYLEGLFYAEARRYGFMGEKIFKELSHGVSKGHAYKVPYSGHYLKKGASLELYEKLRSDVGDQLVLTSGLRALAKQFHLFLEKARETGGNLSRASRSLAPPGYSFHGRGDFDIGMIGLGLENFSDRFADTEVYQKLIELGYVDIRYTEGNLLGVRFEPWHIKVES